MKPDHTAFFLVPVLLVVTGIMVSLSAQSDTLRPIWFGTLLDPQVVMSESNKLAKSLLNPGSSTWQAKGDQKRTYNFTGVNSNEPYRVCVPPNWDGTSKLPLVMFLHGAGSNESTYLDQNNKQMVTLAEQHGFLLVSPMGDQGAYGNFLRLTAPFGDSLNAAKLMQQVTAASERTNELSEKDVINVLELILMEYPVDQTAMFLAGHSMGSGGTWYLGGKYPDYWAGLAPMSGPFVQESGYPWKRLGKIPVFITEGIQTPSLGASRLLRDWMDTQEYAMKYEEVDADHGGMIQLVLPDIFAFFDSCRTHSVAVSARQAPTHPFTTPKSSAEYRSSRFQQYTHSSKQNNSNTPVLILDMLGRVRYSGIFSTITTRSPSNFIRLPAGAYHVWSSTSSQKVSTPFVVKNVHVNIE